MHDDDDYDGSGLKALVDAAHSLTGRTVSLVMPLEAHIADLVKLANNMNVASQTATMPHPYTDAHARAWVAGAGRKDDRRAFVIILKSNPDTDRAELIGGCSFGPAPQGYRGVQIGYWLGEAYWGCGYAAEACQVLIDHIFTNSSVEGIWATCRVVNARSRRVIEKCGFQFRENSLEMSVSSGSMQSVERFILDRRVWQSLKAWGRLDDLTEDMAGPGLTVSTQKRERPHV